MIILNLILNLIFVNLNYCNWQVEFKLLFIFILFLCCL